MSSGDQPTPRGRGRARPRIRQAGNDSPTRPAGFGPGTSSPDNVVVQGSGTPPYPEVTARIGEISIQHPGRSSETLVPEINPDGKNLRGASRGLRFDRDGDLIRNDFDVITRPAELVTKQGNKGVTRKMVSNYFKLKHAKSWNLFEYRVDFDPATDHNAVRKILMRQNEDKLGGYIFDGTKVWSSTDVGEVFEFQAISKRRKRKDETEEPPEVEYKVTLRRIGPLRAGDPMFVQFYNLILRKCLFSMGLEEVGRHFYSPNDKIDMKEQRLVLWPGYVTSLRQHEQNMLLCVETTHKVLRTDTVLDLIKQMQQQFRGKGEDFIRGEVGKMLKDSIVLTHYNKKTYKVEDVVWTRKPTDTFDMRKRGPTSYVDYYKEKYEGLTVTDVNQPILVAKVRATELHDGRRVKSSDENDQPLWQQVDLLPEFCFMTGLTDKMRENFQLMKALSEHLHVKPSKRVEELNAFMKRLQNSDVTNELHKWGLAFEKNLEKLDGRTLPSEKIIFKTGEHPVDDKGDFTMAFRQHKMLTSVNLENWVVLVPQRDAGGVDNLIKTMAKVASPINMRILPPKQIIEIRQPTAQNYITEINAVVNQHKDLQLLFVIVPTKSLEPYSTIKKRLASDLGFVSQCFVARNIMSKGLMSIATKVVVQMNAKLGGEPWSIKLPLKSLMVVGFDVYHGGKGGGKNFGAMVATVTPSLAKYYSTVSEFTRDEISTRMTVDITKCCQAFKRENGSLPERIMFFRDGVGEGDLHKVFTTEIKQLKDALWTLYKGANVPEPKFTFIVVTKKINSRVMLERGNSFDNPPPGTIVDDVITLPERYDFFLVSCAARQGTVSPCMYHVLCDSQGLDPDKIQMIAFKLCHMYFNWSGTVAVPAPCQYAHKLAFITGVSYKGYAHERLSNLLHFL